MLQPQATTDFSSYTVTKWPIQEFHCLKLVNEHFRKLSFYIKNNDVPLLCSSNVPQLSISARGIKITQKREQALELKR